VPGYIEPSYAAITEFMTPLLAAGVTPLALGGDHSITLAELRAIAARHGKVSLLHFDSHLDLNTAVFGQPYNHGTPFRRALEEGLIDPATSIQVGMRGSLYDPDDFKVAAELGFKVLPAHVMREMGLAEVIKAILERLGRTKVFCTFDVDFVDPAYAPGTGTPEVGGFTTWEVLRLVRALNEVHFVGFDIVEVLPAIDPAELTPYVAANLGFEFLSILAWRKKHGKN
jgi:agmatinase